MMQPDIFKAIETKFNADDPFTDYFAYHQTGSRYTCNPPVLDTDEDWICHLSDNEAGVNEAWQVGEMLIEAGYATSPDQQQYPDCMSYRKGAINIIVVYDCWMYKNWVKATEVCKFLNLLKKEDRKQVHRIICGEPT
jgi:hypothetical protein